MSNITFVHSEDWVAMYVAGDLAIENHSLRPEEVVEALGFPYESIFLEEGEVEALDWQFPRQWNK